MGVAPFGGFSCFLIQDVGDGSLLTSLYLKRVSVESFGKYFLVAKNEIGSTRIDVELVLLSGISPGKKPPFTVTNFCRSTKL